MEAHNGITEKGTAKLQISSTIITILQQESSSCNILNRKHKTATHKLCGSAPSVIAILWCYGRFCQAVFLCSIFCEWRIVNVLSYCSGCCCLYLIYGGLARFLSAPVRAFPSRPAKPLCTFPGLMRGLWFWQAFAQGLPRQSEDPATHAQ